MHDEPTAPALGIDLPPWRIRCIARTNLVRGVTVQLDTPLNNPDSENLEIADSGSGLVTATFVQANAARSAKLIGVAESDADDNQKLYVTIRGRTRMWVGGSGSSGAGLTVGSLETGNRIVAKAAEAWSDATLLDVLFDGVEGFGTYIAEAEEGVPTVTITSPADGASFEEGASITFTGTASDPEDGDLSATLDWTSSEDGALVLNDNSFSTSSLSVGVHTITASTEDSAMNEAEDSITINITEPGGGGGGHDDPPGDGGGGIGITIA